MATYWENSCSFGLRYVFMELWTIRTLANSALVNSDPKKYGPSQFGPRPLANSDPDHWSIRTFFSFVNSDLKKKNSLVNSDLFSWSIRTFSIGQFGPFPLVNSDLFHLPIRTFALCIFHIENCAQIKTKQKKNKTKQTNKKKTSRPYI